MKVSFRPDEMAWYQLTWIPVEASYSRCELDLGDENGLAISPSTWSISPFR